MTKHRNFFARFANKTAHAVGHPLAFVFATLSVIVWAATGPIFGYSDTWQLVINTGTTVLTFLIVFLIQNSQNRESVAVQLKLDELIRAMEGASGLAGSRGALRSGARQLSRAIYQTRGQGEAGDAQGPHRYRAPELEEEAQELEARAGDVEKEESRRRGNGRAKPPRRR